MNHDLRIRILEADDEITAVFPLVHQLRDRVRSETFLDEVRAQQREGYLLACGFAGAKSPVCMAGFRITSTLARGPHLFVDDLVASSDARGKGYGTQMLRWIALYARERNIERIYLDSRDTAAGFYQQIGFTFLTSIPCWITTAQMLSAADA